MKYEPRYLEENVNVSRRDYGREFVKLALILFALTAAVFLVLGFVAERLAVHLPLGVEKALGAAFVRQIDEGGYPETRAYAQKVLDRVAAASEGLPPFEYRVDIVDDNLVNAVALPAGRIVLFRGLAEKIESEEALAMVLAHELGHYVNRDHLRGLGRGLVLMAVAATLGANGEVPRMLVPSLQLMDLRYSRRQEESADRFAIDAVIKAYGQAGGALGLYDILEKDDRCRFCLPFLSTHPQTRQRKDGLEARLRSRGYEQGAATPLPGDGRLPLEK